MLIYIRSIVFTLGYAFSVIIYGSLGAVMWFVPPQVRHKIIVSWCWMTVNFLRLVCGVRYQVTGLENFKKKSGPYVVLSKHQSPWETFLLQSIFFPVSTVLKKELLNIPFFGWGLRCFRPIGIDRSKPREALRQIKLEGVKSLKKGLNLLLFPEGTRIAVGKRGKYARGGTEIAIAAGVDIIPVALNPGHCWPMKTMLRYPGNISVVIGEPIAPAGRTSREVMAEVESWIENQMEKMEATDSK